MSSPLTLPIARLRATGARVHTILGHGPITTGKSPAATSRWQYGIVLPDGVEIRDIDGELWSYNHDWSDMLGDAHAWVFRDGRIMVNGFACPIENPTPARLRAHRKTVESEVAELLARIALVIEAKNSGKVI